MYHTDNNMVRNNKVTYASYKSVLVQIYFTPF